MRRRPHRHSLAQQAYALRARYPDAIVSLSTTNVRWTGVLCPGELCGSYLVRMNYRPGGIAKVCVLRPELEPRLGESLPHVYRGDALCLHEDDDWAPTMLLSDTIIPWTSEWLFFYEIWKVTGEWHGGGLWPPTREAKATITEGATPGGAS